MLRAILLAALLAGALAGAVVTGLQAIRVVPLILAAETYEEGGAAGLSHGHAMGDEDGRAPDTPLLRTLATAAANLLTAIGFALLLAAALALTGSAGWHRGLLWGLGGYAAFVLAPSIGMPEGSLEARQLWWLGTALATAAGLYLLFRVRVWYGALLGALCLVLPHLIGAPAPVVADGPVPAELVHAFRSATQAVNLIFWLVLGTATGYLLARLAQMPPQDA
jgi:cobalt transporter subunit CbtA